MTKTKGMTSQSTAQDGVIEMRQDAARHYMGVQERSDNWKPLLSSVPVRFMELRMGMCRWPIGDPHHLESFRFCGCACASEAIYCDTHKQVSVAPNRARALPISKSLLALKSKVA